MGWLYVPGLADLNSECELRLEETSVWCVTSSGKPTQQPLSWRGWKIRPWIARLSGTISRPSMAARGVASWIVSLRESRASPTASPESALDTQTNAHFGPNSCVSSENASQRSSSSKTRQISFTTSDLFGASYGAWVSSLHRRCYRPPRSSVDHTSENASLSLLPTPRASDGNKGGPNQKGSKGGLMMTSFVAMLPTPTAQQYGSNRGGAAGRIGEIRPSIETLVTSLPTPLSSQRQARGQNSQRGEVLDAVVKLLPTPTASDWKSSGAAGYSTESGRHSGTTLTDAVLGAASAGRTGKLNPRLSEWIQGFPVGWMSSAPLEMRSFRLWLRRHGLI